MAKTDIYGNRVSTTRTLNGMLNQEPGRGRYTALSDDDPRHGHHNTYFTLGCRCRACTTEATAYVAEKRRVRETLKVEAMVASIYGPERGAIWLGTPSALLKGEVPQDLLDEGKPGRVLRVLGIIEEATMREEHERGFTPEQAQRITDVLNRGR